MDELERRGQLIADAMGRYRGTEPLVEAVARMADQLFRAERELGRWQEAIRELAIKESGATDHTIDGAGCDSGDPLDFTLAEISQGFAVVRGER